jgi:membrane-associated phospholipid phosphatase
MPNRLECDLISSRVGAPSGVEQYLDPPARMIEFLTDFADQALILPTIVLIGGWLLLAEPRRTVVAWGAACAVSLGLILLLKLVMPCTPFANDLRSPSGHTASTVLVAGGLLVLLTGPGRRRRLIASAAGILMGVLIGATRLWLHAHTVPEVIAGLIIGSLGLAVFAMADLSRPRLPPVTLMVAFVMLAVALHGHRLHADRWISTLACRLH